MLEGIEFGKKLRQWIRHCNSSPMLSVLVNGKPTRQFGLERGLRQWDSLSPFLFNVAVEGLSALFRKVEDFNLMKGACFESEEMGLEWGVSKISVFVKTIGRISDQGEVFWKILEIGLTVVIAVVWTMWETRNEKVFKDGDTHLSQAKDMEGYGVGDSLIGSFKFNVDGSARGFPFNSGISGVLRDDRGKVLCLFSTNVGIQDVVTTEILALAKACNLCLGKPELLDRNIEFVSDSMVVVLWINGPGIGSLKHIKTIYNI
ncbi:hypothetical protein Ddye_001729 [Dipteronia dyeriana]|uniref:RNase H type-1 domain-containing protein n=1 Tax=Dipteronia dyeriana TaxID=168575 RepID=A0AAD9XPT3_9ROSI|nr:hypothetical protein Ddye_001729 [Dipteronia dyeriana]